MATTREPAARQAATRAGSWQQYDVVWAAAVAGGADEGVAVGQVDEAGHRDSGGLSLFNLIRRTSDCCCHK